MKTRTFRYCAALAVFVCVVGFAIAVGTSQSRAAREARAQIQRWADRFAWYAGLTWHHSEEIADDVRSDVASKFTAVRDKLLPSTSQEPMPTPSGVHEIVIVDEVSVPIASRSEP
jgi:hypothetical protein